MHGVQAMTFPGETKVEDLRIDFIRQYILFLHKIWYNSNNINIIIKNQTKSYSIYLL